ncbi:MAG: VOC family protein [Ignavibacteriales bacterium]
MIIKIDHIAVLSVNPKREKKLMDDMGFNLSFKEEDIYNPEIKKDLMQNFWPKQSLYLYTKAGSISFEYIYYSGKEGKKGYIEPVIKENRVKELILKTKDLKKSAEFWNCFGFRTNFQDSNEIKMEFKSMFDKEIYSLKILLDSNKEQQHFLDDAGFNCVAFVSNSALKEKEKLIGKGYSITNIEDIEVNEKMLKVFFVIGPCGELVEIISI